MESDTYTLCAMHLSVIVLDRGQILLPLSAPELLCAWFSAYPDQSGEGDHYAACAALQAHFHNCRNEAILACVGLS